jgi:hypothetical protein
LADCSAGIQRLEHNTQTQIRQMKGIGEDDVAGFPWLCYYDMNGGAMTWEEHYRLWSEVRQRPGNEAYRRLQAARKRVAENDAADWEWLRASLDDPQRKWFVAEVFRFQSVPKRLRGPMLRAGVYERNPSLNRRFVEPCVRSYGTRWVGEKLLRYLETGTDVEKAGAASALYWAWGNPGEENLTDLRRRIRCRMLWEFVDNEDLEIRRRIIPGLDLAPEHYPEPLRPLVPRAVKIARSHPDDYIRHRVEVQLGAGGPYMAIPDTDPMD